MIIQGIGVIALIANLSVFQTNKRQKMILFGLCGCLLWAMHFYLLGALTGMALNLVAAVRFYVYYRTKPTKSNIWIMWSFLGITALATILTWQGWISLLPFIGTASGVVAFWQTNTKYIRRLAMASPPPWLLYALMVGSYPGIVVESLLLLSNLVGQARFDFKKTDYRKLLRIPSR